MIYDKTKLNEIKDIVTDLGKKNPSLAIRVLNTHSDLNWPSDIYAKIHYCFVKAYNLFDYPVYETEIKELYTSFLSSDSLPNCLIEHILLTNTRFCGNDEKIQRILSRRNLPQYIMEYSLASLLGFELIGNIPYLCIRKHQAN